MLNNDLFIKNSMSLAVRPEYLKKLEARRIRRRRIGIAAFSVLLGGAIGYTARSYIRPTSYPERRYSMCDLPGVAWPTEWRSLPPVYYAEELREEAKKNPNKEDRQKATGQYEQGMRFYNSGFFTEALAHFTDAYIAYPDISVLFNLAQVHRLMGNTHYALSFYRAFLQAKPNAPHRAEVQQRIAELEPKPVPDTIVVGTCFIAPKIPTDPSQARRLAETELQKGKRLFQMDYYAEAAQAFQTAYLITTDPRILFDIGRCYHRMNDKEQALFFYRRYLKITIIPPNREEVEKFIQELEGKTP